MADFVQEFFTSRQNYADGNTRLGQLDRLWYDSITNTIRISDGITPGGIIVSGGGGGTSGYSGYSGFSGSGIQPWIRVTSNYTAANGDRIIADTSGGAFTIDLPATPSLGDYVQILGVGDFATNNLTIGGNGSTIEGLPTDLVLTSANGIYDFIYDGTTWQVVEPVLGQSGYSGVSGYSGATGSGISNWVLETSNYTSANGDRIIADTQAGSFTIYLPASPNLGDYVQITDGWDFAINNCFVDPNGSTVEGYPDNVALDLKGVTFEFIYSGTTWQVTGTTGARGQSGYSGTSGTSGFSGALDPWVKITSNYLASNSNRLIADTQAGSFTVFLPATPVTGDYIQITDGWDLAINNCFVDPNGSTVEGYADIVALDLSHVTYEFIYNGSTWEVTGTTGARGQSGYSGYSGIKGALDPWVKLTSNYLAENGNRLIADTQAGSFTVFLPILPITGDYIQITDGWDLAINNCFVDPNGSTVEGYPDIVALDLSHVTYEFIYNSSTWEVTGTTGARGQSGYSGVGGPGASGYSGYSGVGGTGASGYSGFSGQSFSGDYVSSIIAGTGVSITGSSGTAATPTVSIGQPVATTDSVTFQNVVIASGGKIQFEDDVALSLLTGAVPYKQITAAGRFYTNADALLGLSTADMKPGDFYYDDVSASIYLCIDTGLGYFDLLDLTVRV